MILITVEVCFSDANVDEAISKFEAQSGTVRAMNGCEGYSLYRNDTAVVIVQKWQNNKYFDAYRESEAFAKLGNALKPLMKKAPVTTVANIRGC